jgi:hypothetical protein
MSYQFSQDPEENLPDWLKELRARQSGELKPSDTEPQPDIEPESQPESDSTSPPPEAPSPEPDEGEPEWLLDIRRRVQRDQPPEPEPSSPPEDLSLEDTRPEPTFPPEETTPLEITEEPSEDDKIFLGDTQPQPATPAFLDEPAQPPFAEEDEESPDEVPPDEHAPAFQAPRGTADLPDWFFDEETPEEGEAMPHAPAFQDADEEGAEDDEAEPLAPAELPSWLEALRPQGLTTPSQPYTESWDDEEGEGPLAGLSGVLPVEPEILEVGRTGSLTGRIEINANQQRHAETLQELIASEYAAKEDFHRRISLPNRLLRLGIAGVLLLAALIPLLTGTHSATRPADLTKPESAAFFQIAESLPADSSVLVAFEVQPALYGEVQAVAAAVLNHLLDGQARLVFLSTESSGPALTERLLREKLSNQPSIASGSYLNLGYLSGGTAAIRQLATDPRSFHPDQWLNPALADINSLSDFGLVLVIASDGDQARDWIEQLGPELPEGLLVTSSAQAGPLLIPYMDSQPHTLRGLVAGLSGAAYYEALRGKQGLASNYWDAYSYGVGAVVILILLGGLYGRLIHIRPEQRPKTFEEMEEEDES